MPCVSAVLLLDVMEDLFNYINPHNGKHSPMVAKSTLDIVLANKDVCIMLFWWKFFL